MSTDTSEPLFTFNQTMTQKVQKTIMGVLLISAAIAAGLGAIGQEQFGWDEMISNVLYFVAAVDILMAFTLPRFISAQISKIQFRFFDDRMEYGSANRTYGSVSYDNITNVIEKRTEQQKYSGLTTVVLELSGAAPGLGAGNSMNKLEISNIPSSQSPVGQITDAVERHKRRRKSQAAE